MSRHLTRRVKEYLYDNVAVVTDLTDLQNSRATSNRATLDVRRHRDAQ